ncbi:ABC transporter permease [Microbacterium rhizosphaerae]|uniref:ABC transporter permease n=1 Tax=Microbacterium rhizosphaerae TaxID=1678237 RepID=A0ABZ0SNB9_9MICO|nr:ABC transporter permease [Microbacterium rhizosphaerae]WPR89328.1 ABC transporter permease [Microbacterium rhizosphaerae]
MSTTAPTTTATSAVVVHRQEQFDQSAWYRLIRRDEVGIFAATVVLILAAAIFAPHFLDADNLLSIAQQIAIIAIVAAGMTYVIVVGEIDLSVGSQYGFLAVFFAWSIHDWGIPAGAAIPATLILGLGTGALNGVVTTIFGIPSFVVTLAALAVYRGAALLLSEGVPIIASKNEVFRAITSGYLFPGLSAQTLWMILLLLVLGVVLAFTRFGSNVYSVGGNRSAAADAGIDVNVTKIICFALTGFLCAVAALLLTGWLGSGNPLTGTGFELSVIAAVVVGGASLTGGKGTIVGTFLGAVVAGVLNNALILAGISNNWQQVATGLLIVVAVFINRLVAKRTGADLRT